MMIFQLFAAMLIAAAAPPPRAAKGAQGLNPQQALGVVLIGLVVSGPISPRPAARENHR
jgi:hypothetical protein